MNAIRKGVGVVQAAGYTPNAVLLNPADWATLDINVFSATLLGPTDAVQSFWGLTPGVRHVPTRRAPPPSGTSPPGCSGTSARRRHCTCQTVDQDDFIQNLFTILAETSAKTVVTRPTALVEVHEEPVRATSDMAPPTAPPPRPGVAVGGPRPRRSQSQSHVNPAGDPRRW